MSKTYTNPENPDQTYTLGQRGKRPNWVIPLLTNDNVDLTPKVKQAKENLDSYKGLFQWALRSDNKEPLCLIVEENETQACLAFNKTAKCPLTINELRSEIGIWVKTKLEEVILTKGVWCKKDGTWVEKV